MLLNLSARLPGRRVFTGGSDEHAGLFIGETYTEADGNSKEAFLACVRNKATDSGGRSNHYKTQVYTFLKIIHQYSRQRRGSAVKRAWDELCGAIFDGKSLGWKTQLKIETAQAQPQRQCAAYRLTGERSRAPASARAAYAPSGEDQPYLRDRGRHRR